MPATRAGSRVGAWTWPMLALAALTLLPVLALAWLGTQGSAGLWQHLARHVLPQATLNTVLLLGGVGLLAGAIGAGSAWLVSAYRFPGRGVLAWALLLPLAVPTYIVAYSYVDLLHPLGPVQGAMRAMLGFDSPREWRLPDLRSLPLAIVVIALVLYPYVYLTTRALLSTQSASLLEAGRALGLTRRQVFWRLAMPLARPALAVGVALVLLETLNDIGASEFIGVQTLTTAIYTTWVSRSDLPGAAQIALALLAMVLLLLALERHGRRRQGYAGSSRRLRAMTPEPLAGMAGWRVTALCALPVLFGFVLPAAHLLGETLQRLDGGGISPQLWRAALDTLRLALAATVLTVLAGLLLAMGLRMAQQRRATTLPATAFRIATLGYALPGTVLAIGLMVALGWIDAARAGGTLLIGSSFALVLAYGLRFLTIAAGTLDAGYGRLPHSLDQAAATLGAGAWQRALRLHLPLLQPSLAAAALLVLVDAMKELPATLMLRPLGMETLATWLYAEAARGTYEEGAVAGLLIVAAGLLPVAWLARSGLQPLEERVG